MYRCIYSVYSVKEEMGIAVRMICGGGPKIVRRDEIERSFIICSFMRFIKHLPVYVRKSNIAQVLCFYENEFFF